MGVKLKEAAGAIYNNDSGQAITGSMKGTYMAAYNATSGFVESNEEETRRTAYLKFNTPSNVSMVTAKCTRIMLKERLREMVLCLDNFGIYNVVYVKVAQDNVGVNVEQFDFVRNTNIERGSRNV